LDTIVWVETLALVDPTVWPPGAEEQAAAARRRGAVAKARKGVSFMCAATFATGVPAPLFVRDTVRWTGVRGLGRSPIA
jgi:hypothetical protein